MLFATQVGLMRVRRGLPSGSSSQVGQNVERDQVCKTVKKRRESIPRRLVHKATVGAKLVVRLPDENLWLQQCVCVGENECLP